MDLDIFPEFLRFKPPNLSAYSRPSELHKLGLKKKLKEVHVLTKNENKKYQFEKKRIVSQLSFFEKSSLIFLLKKEFEKSAQAILNNHFRKLTNLYRRQSVKCPNAVTNLSGRKLSLREFHALRFSLNHPILPRKVKKDEMKTNVENLLYKLKRETNFTNLDDDFQDQVKFYTSRRWKESKRICPTLQNKSLHQTLRKLQQDGKIKVCHYVKGRGIAIHNDDDYYSKLECIINDSTKFSQIDPSTLNQHPIIAKENSIVYYVKRYFKSYGKNVVEQLIPWGSSPGKLYGRIKVHKKDNPARPVVSAIRTAEYQLAKFLKLIKPYIPSKFMLDSSQEFIDKLKCFAPKPDHVMVSQGRRQGGAWPPQLTCLAPPINKHTLLKTAAFVLNFQPWPPLINAWPP